MITGLFITACKLLSCIGERCKSEITAEEIVTSILAMLDLVVTPDMKVIKAPNSVQRLGAIIEYESGNFQASDEPELIQAFCSKIYGGI